MPTPTWFAALLDEIVPLTLVRPIRKLRWVRLARNGAARTMITAIETNTAPPFNLSVEGGCAAGEPHAVTPSMLKHANMKLSPGIAISARREQV
jgi:hypothetical protein